MRINKEEEDAKNENKIQCQEEIHGNRKWQDQKKARFQTPHFDQKVNEKKSTPHKRRSGSQSRHEKCESAIANVKIPGVRLRRRLNRKG